MMEYTAANKEAWEEAFAAHQRGWKTDPADTLLKPDGIDYVGGTSYPSKPFYSFSHTVAAVITGIARSGMRIEKMQEYPVDVSASFGHLNDHGVPLSYLLQARREP